MVKYKLVHYTQEDIVEVNSYPCPVFGTSKFIGFPRKGRYALFEENTLPRNWLGPYDKCEEFAEFLENIQKKFFDSLYHYKKDEYSSCNFDFLTGVTYLLESNNKEYKSYCFLTTKENSYGRVVDKDYGIILIPTYVNTSKKIVDYFIEKFKKRSLDENILYREFFENVKIKSSEELKEILECLIG